MNERFIYLLERNFEKGLTSAEKDEFNSLLENDITLKKEFEEQKKIKDVFSKMSLKNPTDEFWDGYWQNIYNRIERGIAWTIISIGAAILLIFGCYSILSELFNNPEINIVVKFGSTFLIIGMFVLLFSLVREKIFKLKKDKYKEIQR